MFAVLNVVTGAPRLQLLWNSARQAWMEQLLPGSFQSAVWYNAVKTLALRFKPRAF